MHERLQQLRDRVSGQSSEEDNAPASEFKGLRLLTAHLFLLTGIDATLNSINRVRERHGPPYPHGSAGPVRVATTMAASLAPTLLAPLAAVAHAKHGINPTTSTASATRILSAAVIGAGIAGLVDSLVAGRGSRRFPSLTPLALASAGVLGLILEREEREVVAARRRLERRASIINRLVPQRRARLERIVLHV